MTDKPNRPPTSLKNRRSSAGSGNGTATSRPTMADIARLADVSVSTVSRSLAGSRLIPQSMREKIEAIARENGYVLNQAARNLRLQHTRTIGLVMPLGHDVEQDITDPFLLEMIGFLSQAVMRAGYEVLLTRVDSPSPGWLKDLTSSNRVDGVIIVGQSNQHTVIDEVARSYRPIVVWGEKIPGQTYCSVGVDNVLGGNLATRHLIETGRKVIRFMGPLGVPEFDSRYQGYLQVMKGAPQDTVHSVYSGLTHEAAMAAMTSLLATGHRFDAIFAASDVIAHGAKTAFIANGGKVPTDCAFVGFDDVAMAKHLSPPLTTVHQPMKAACQTMVELLLRRIAGEDTASVILTPRLVERHTTRLRN